MELDNKCREIETGNEYTKMAHRGDKDVTFKACLGRLRNNFLKKYDDREESLHAFWTYQTPE